MHADMNVCVHGEDGLIRKLRLGFPKRSHVAKGLNTFPTLDMPQSDKCNDRFYSHLFIYLFTHLFIYNPLKKEDTLNDVFGIAGLMFNTFFLLIVLINT